MAGKNHGLILRNEAAAAEDGEFVVVLLVDGKTVETVGVSSRAGAEAILESWKQGAYQLLNEAGDCII